MAETRRPRQTQQPRQLTPAERRRAVAALLLLQAARQGRTINGQIAAGRQGAPRGGRGR